MIAGILRGAAFGVMLGVDLLALLLLGLERFHIHYSDVILGYVMFLMLLCLPIVGGWRGWVINRRLGT